jgi:hypothetical protein
MFVNRGLWDLGRSILRGDREAQAERLANRRVVPFRCRKARNPTEAA